MSFSNAMELLVYDWAWRPAQTPTRPVGLFCALFTVVTDSEAGTGTEVTGGSYARVNVGTAIGAATSPGGNGSNTSIVTFAAPTATWGTVIAFGIFDAVTVGSPVSALITLGASRLISSGDAAPQFAIGALTVAVG